MLRRLTRQFIATLVEPSPSTMSSEWMREIERQSTRIEYHGPRMTFPIRKISDAAGKFNAHRLRGLHRRRKAS